MLLAGCGQEREPPEPPPSRLEPSSPPPSERSPLREGFTQRPRKDTPGLPPPAEPLFTEAELESLKAARLEASAVEKDRAQAELLSLIEEYERNASEAAPEANEALVARVRAAAVDHARGGRVSYGTAEALFKEFLFPRDRAAAAATYHGKAVVISGAVAPHNMVDLADGFKLVEQTPYVHEPVLLATDYELFFLRCHLARKELQKLRDWQELHLLGVVEGKTRGDLILRRCIAL